MTSPACLVLRLAGPLQSWGDRSQFNRRQTRAEPTKSGILGLLAAAAGRRRSDPIEDLVALTLGVRTDQAGSLLRDYHTVSDYRGVPLLSSIVNAKGKQKPAGQKMTHVTQRYYLQDAIFVAAICGPPELLANLGVALRNPSFPLALGRRSCPPTLPLVLTAPAEHRTDLSADLWPGNPEQVLNIVPWQIDPAAQGKLGRRGIVDLPTVIDLDPTDDPADSDVRADVPGSFEPTRRSFSSRRVRTGWATMGSLRPEDVDRHDPFALLGW